MNADPDVAGDFFDAALPRGVTRAVVRERDRVPLDGALPGDGYRLIVEVFVESGPRGQLSTWRLDIRRPSGTVAEAGDTETPWRVVAHDRLSQVDALHRLALDRERVYTAKDFVLTSVDFELRLPLGTVFVANTAEGVSALVMIGDGQLTFRPTPKTEQGQVRLFAGADAARDAASIRPTCGSARTTSSTTSRTACSAPPRPTPGSSPRRRRSSTMKWPSRSAST